MTLTPELIDGIARYAIDAALVAYLAWSRRTAGRRYAKAAEKVVRERVIPKSVKP